MSYKSQIDEREHLIVRSIVVVLVWIIAMIFWSFWLEGVVVPVAGLLTSMIFELTVHIGEKIWKD